MIQSTKLKIMQINIKSISNKKDILEHYMEHNNIHIGIICETWLYNDNINFKNYNILHKNRIDGYRGVAIWILKRLKIEAIQQKNYAPFETIETYFYSNQSKYKIISLYIRPQTNLTDPKTSFENLLRDNNQINNLIIAGDVNCHNSL